MSNPPRRIPPRPALLPLTYARPAPRMSRRSRRESLGRLSWPHSGVRSHHIERVELDAATDPAGLIGGDEGRARAKEWVDDDVATIGEVEERVLEHRGRLDGRMVLEARRASEPSDEAPGYVQTFERQRPRLPSSTLLTWGADPFLNSGRQFVLRAIEAAHAGVGLRPDDEIEGNRPSFAAAE